MSEVIPVDNTSSTPIATASPKTKTNDAKTEKKKRNKKKSKRNSRKPTLKTKVIVRRLAPNLPEDIFMNSVKPWVSEDNVTYSLYVPGKLSKSKAKESVFSRAYFHFKTMEAVIAFHQGFDGHVFMDSRGNESRAVVEFAPYQRIPKEIKAIDTRQGTIDQDQDYLDFLESLKAEEQAQSELDNEPADGLTQIERLENRIAMVTAKTLAAEQANKPKTTPLLEHLRAQKAAQAAAKAKKRERKRAEKTAPSKKESASDQWKVIQQQIETPKGQTNATATTTPSEGKKKRERRKKNAEKKAANRAGDAASVSSSVSSATTASTQSKASRPPKEPKEPKAPRPPKEPKASRPPKEGASKPKRSNNKKSNESGSNTPKQAPIKILGRQQPAPNKTTTG